MSNRKLILIDANSFCYRAFYAIRGLATSYGQPTNAVYGFVNMLKKVLKNEQPDYLGICFDVGKQTLREKKFSEYKIHREPMPDDLKSQMPIIKEVISAFNLPMLELEGYEADDVIATVASKLAGKDLEVKIISGDKDILQLVGKNIKVVNPSKEDAVFDRKMVIENFGVEPERLRDLFALMGDKTDNIPGITGIGEVTAKSLLQEFGSLENILDTPDKIKSEKLRELVKHQRAQAILSRDLATLEKDVPVDFDLDSLKPGQPDQQKLLELFKKLEFKNWLKELSPPDSGREVSIKAYSDGESDEALRQISSAKKEFGIWVDCASEVWPQVKIGGIYLAFKKDEVAAFPALQLNRLRQVLEDEKIAKITHDFKTLLVALEEEHIEINGKVFDVMLAAYLLDPAKTNFSLEELSWEYLGSSLNAKLDAAAKTDAVFKLKPILEEQLKEKELLELFFKVEMPLAKVLARMELNGVKIDTGVLKELSVKMQVRTKELITKIYHLAGEEFNINSPKQLARILFERLKLPVVKKTKTGFSTDEEVLSRLAGQHPLPAMLLEYRQLVKLTSTYIDALPELINPATGRVHTSFNQTGTETGRLSSSRPNLQNIPIKTELGRSIRKAFVAGGGNFSLLCADYSQIELRVLAHLSGDENLVRAFKKDEDIHKLTASLIFNQKLSEVTDAMRDTAKRVNFGIIYGISAYGLAKDLGVGQEQAQDFIDAYFLRYPKVRGLCDALIKKARKDGFVTTILGRRRYLPQINSSNNSLRQFSERQAINAPVQGSAADLIKLAMINIQEELHKNKLQSRLTLQVHDELVFDCPDAEMDEMQHLVRETMEHVLQLSVPVKVSITTGKNWLEQKYC
jgi:DNA polymerase I